MALSPLPRACCMVAVALWWAPLVASPARGEDGTQDRIAVGTVVCSERSAVDDVMAIVHDADAEDPVRRLTLILSSGECTDHRVGLRVEEAGIVDARLRGRDVYLVTLTGNR